jgi:hypothetical protein
MHDISFNSLDLLIILSGFAGAGTLVGLAKWLADKATAAKRRKTMLSNDARTTTPAAVTHKVESREVGAK